MTHGKTILLGEHAVVYGKPAIAFPVKSLQLKAEAHTIDGEQNYLKTPFFEGTLSANNQSNEPTAKNLSETALRNVLAWLGNPSQRVNVEVTGLIPPARGLGSSAAVAGAIIRAVSELFSARMKPEELFDLVQSVEKVAHGTPSGLDAHATNSNEPIWFKAGLVSPLENSKKPQLLVADTGLKGHTVQAVQRVRKDYEVNTRDVVAKFDEIERLTIRAKDYLADADFEKLGTVMNENQEVLRELGVSHSELERLISVSRESGALGAKLTGGGMGGCLVVLAETQEKLVSLKETLLQNGAESVWLVSEEEETT